MWGGVGWGGVGWTLAQKHSSGSSADGFVDYSYFQNYINGWSLHVTDIRSACRFSASSFSCYFGFRPLCLKNISTSFRWKSWSGSEPCNFEGRARPSVLYIQLVSLVSYFYTKNTWISAS